MRRILPLARILDVAARNAFVAVGPSGRRRDRLLRVLWRRRRIVRTGLPRGRRRVLGAAASNDVQCGAGHGQGRGVTAGREEQAPVREEGSGTGRGQTNSQAGRRRHHPAALLEMVTRERSSEIEISRE